MPKRGRPARISRAQIVAAARDMDASELTMQTVADTLGVTRKAINYHVTDRAELVELVVLDRFKDRLNKFDLPYSGDWREMVCAYAQAIRDGIVEVGALATHYPVSTLAAPAALDVAEQVLSSLVAAGLDVHGAGKALTLVNDAASDAARQVLLLDDHRVHPMARATSRALASAPDADLPLLRQVAAAGGSADDLEEQFNFTLAVLVAGIERLLAKDTTD